MTITIPDAAIWFCGGGIFWTAAVLLLAVVASRLPHKKGQG